MTGDDKVLQLGTSYELGKISPAFSIDYLSATSRQELCWPRSGGTSTRLIGGVIIIHGDGNDLRVSPRLVAVQVLVTGSSGRRVRSEVAGAAAKIKDMLRDAGFTVGLEDLGESPFGRRVSTPKARPRRPKSVLPSDL